MLAAVLQEPGDGSVGDVTAVDDQADLVVRDTAHVVRQGGVEELETQVGSLCLPSVEDRLRDGAVQQPPERTAAGGGRTQEVRVGRGADRDVVRMGEDAVRAERADDGRLLLVENRPDRVDQLVERDAVDLAIGVTQPLS